MDFYDVLDRVVDLLRSRGRVSYRALKRQFGLDDAYLEDLKVELIKSQRLAVDEDSEVLVWTGNFASAPATTPVTDQEPIRLAHTPKHLAEKILTTRAALAGERKQVTVLFADIKDSTELIKDLDPEAAQQLLDPAIHIMMDAVHRYEGTVNQVLGDGIMALFGAPIAHEDHPLRACYAALAMQVTMQPYADEVRRRHGVVLRIRVGLNAGVVVVCAIGNDLHMDYSAVGQTVHLVVRNGVRIAFYEHGSGEPTLVFTNPILYGLATFQPVLERLCQEFRILTIDPRRSGASDPLPRPYTIIDHMEDVRAVIEASWSGPVVGIGISRGGNLLVRLAVAYPALVQGLVMAGTPLAQQGRRPIDQAQEFLRNNDLEGAVRFWGSLIFSEPGLEPLVEQFVKDRLAQPRETILSFFDPDPEMDIAPLLGTVSMPTLIMHGTEDRNVPLEVGRYLAQHIPGARFYAFKGRGHVPVSTATAEFCDVLRCFVRTGSVSATEGAGN